MKSPLKHKSAPITKIRETNNHTPSKPSLCRTCRCSTDATTPTVWSSRNTKSELLASRLAIPLQKHNVWEPCLVRLRTPPYSHCHAEDTTRWGLATSAQYSMSRVRILYYRQDDEQCCHVSNISIKQPNRAPGWQHPVAPLALITCTAMIIKLYLCRKTTKMVASGL